MVLTVLRPMPKKCPYLNVSIINAFKPQKGIKFIFKQIFDYKKAYHFERVLSK